MRLSVSKSLTGAAAVGYGLIAIDVLNSFVPGLQGPDVGILGAAILGTRQGVKSTAQNIANGPRLAKQLTEESARSPFAASGTLTKDALASSRPLPNLGPGQLNNPAIPSGFGKYTTETFRSPSGNFQVHFYMNPTTREVFYGLDYKTIFNSMSGVAR